MVYKRIKLLPLLFLLCLLCACSTYSGTNSSALVPDSAAQEAPKEETIVSEAPSSEEPSALRLEDLFGERLANITLPESIAEGQEAFPVYVAGSEDITLYSGPDTASAVVQTLPNIEPQSYTPGVRFSQINGSFIVYAQQGDWAFCSWAGMLGWVPIHQLEPRHLVEGRLDTQDAALVSVPPFWSVPLQVYYACAAQMYDTYLATFSFGALLTETSPKSDLYYYDEAYPNYDALYQRLQTFFSADILAAQSGTDSAGWPKTPFAEEGRVVVTGALGRGIGILYGVEQFDMVSQTSDSVCARMYLTAYDWIEAKAETPVEGDIVLRKEADGAWRFTQFLSELDDGKMANDME